MDNIVFSPGDLVRARGREWIVLPSTGEGLLKVRPLSGTESDAQVIAPALEASPVKAASFGTPTIDRLDTQEGAQLLADALRLSLRRGAGPFRSAAHLGVEPRAYQLVPLMMALKQSVARLLIADDVGIGKTIEAGLILREWLDRGTVDSFAVLCPPHLVDQWVSELSEKFDVDAVAVTSGRARSLERGLPTSQSLFEAYPYTVVSLDYIKADSRRDDFARACPPLVIVDEAHACVGGERGKHQRFELLQRLANDPTRHMLFLTATPHSGDVAAYDRLLGLVHADLALGAESGDANARERYARRLAQHFVQRRRPDIQDVWDEKRAFAKHETREAPFILTGDFASFQEDVLDYCLSVTQRAGDDQRTRRLAFWGTLALMRCVGSSPAAAASALTNRLAGMADADSIEPVVFDAEDGLLDESDIEPATSMQESEENAALQHLIEAAHVLDANREADPKVKKLVAELTQILKQGAKPVIFCRFIATAEALGEILRKAWPKYDITVVTGRFTPDERRERVEATRVHDNRILVATDCLSEGINLQSLFDAVIHYDLSWNPTRHQQREGRVDRFGQQAEIVRSVMMYGENSAIDGAVLNVIIRKAEEIQKATGVSVPMPEDQESVTAALMQAVLLRQGGARTQMTFDFGASAERFENKWRDTAEGAKVSRARYAQGALKPDEVVPEWRRMRALNGGPDEVGRFTDRALRRVRAPLEKSGNHQLIHLDSLPDPMRERLAQRGLTGTRRISFVDDPSPGITHVGRVHPVVATLAETLAEGALDPISAEGNALGRAGVWRTKSVSQMTTLLVLRLRFQLVTSGRTNRMLLAEEAVGVAFQGLGQDAYLNGVEALELLESVASSNIDADARSRQVENALNRLAGYLPAISALANSRASTLSDDHLRLTEAAGGGATVKVTPVLPADIIGLYVLLPEANS
jgi:superfamily II DNA or RNA helicase